MLLTKNNLSNLCFLLFDSAKLTLNDFDINYLTHCYPTCKQ